MTMTTHSYLPQRLKKEWNYTSTVPWAFMACSRVNFTFTFAVGNPDTGNLDPQGVQAFYGYL